MEGFPRDDLRKILPGCCQVTNVLHGAETLPKISIGWVGCTNVTNDRRQRQTTDRRQTDGRTTTYSEHEHEFTFANNNNRSDTIFSCAFNRSDGDASSVWLAVKSFVGAIFVCFVKLIKINFIRYSVLQRITLSLDSQEIFRRRMIYVAYWLNGRQKEVAR